MATTINIKRGNPYDATIMVTNASGLPYDLTGKTIFFTVKRVTDTSSSDGDAVITKDIASHTNASGGITTLNLTASQTDIVPGDYNWDMRIYAGSPLVQLNTTSGICNILETITKRIS
jgi:hypothetical protein